MAAWQHMTCEGTESRSIGATIEEFYTLILVLIGVLWVAVAFGNLYCFGYASMDSWAYSAPAALASHPLKIITPFLSSFDQSNTGWGLHWPGGPLFNSLITPFLPHHPATFVLIVIFHWLACACMAAALIRYLTSSACLAVFGYLLVLGDRLTFGIIWMQRYEMLGGALAILGLLCLLNDQWPIRYRLPGVAAVFFLLPLLHPVYMGVLAFWLLFLFVRALVSGDGWPLFIVASAAYAIGVGALALYYALQPVQYATFVNHAQENLRLSRTTTPPGFGKFFRWLFSLYAPFFTGTLIFLGAFAETALLARRMVRNGIKAGINVEPMSIMLVIGLIGTLILTQLTFNGYYWTIAWPFAIALAALFIKSFLKTSPPSGWLLIALTGIVSLHGAFWVVRTYKWSQLGFVNFRAEQHRFLESLPREARLIIPETVWDSTALHGRNVILNTLPYNASEQARQRYESFLTSQLHSGDVLVVDRLQSHPMEWSFRDGWRQIAHRDIVWSGLDKPRGIDLTAYVKE